MLTILLLSCVLGAEPKDAWILQKPLGNIFPMEQRSDVIWGETGPTFINRGTLVSWKHFPRGVTVQCDWKWTVGQEKGKHQDHLTIALATDGRQRAWSHEVYDGIIIRFNAAGSSISVFRAKDGEDEPTLLVMVGNIKMKRNKAYAIKVVDNGKTIEIFFAGAKDPTLSIDVADRGEGDRVAIYNREPVGGGLKSSVLEKLVVE